MRGKGEKLDALPLLEFALLEFSSPSHPPIGGSIFYNISLLTHGLL